MPDVKSWRKRRWNIFLTLYNSDEEFREKLFDSLILSEDTSYIDNTIALFIKYDIPIETIPAVKEYLLNPDITDDALLSKIGLPIVYWNKKTIKDERGVSLLPLTYNTPLQAVRKKYGIPEEQADEFTKDIMLSMFSNDTVIVIQPNTSKSELKELMTEFGQAIVDVSQTNDSTIASTKLLGKIYKPAKATTTKRNELLVNLIDKNYSYKEAKKELLKMDYKTPDEDAMRRIVYLTRLKQKSHDS